MDRAGVVFGFRSRAPFVTEQIELPGRRLTGDKPVLRFGQLSDLHMRAFGAKHRELTRTINQLDLDFLCLTGDFIALRPDTWHALKHLLLGLRCRHGIFACRGNWEVKRDLRPSVFKEMMAAWGVRALINESCLVETASGIVRISGVDDVRAGWPRFDAAWRNGPRADLGILLSHVPITARFVRAGDGIDLVLSGHTHGGQFRIPLVWPLLLPRCSGGFVGGLYPMGWGQLYVSRGFGGVGVLPLRFRCPAELAVFTVQRLPA